MEEVVLPVGEPARADAASATCLDDLLLPSAADTEGGGVAFAVVEAAETEVESFRWEPLGAVSMTACSLAFSSKLLSVVAEELLNMRSSGAIASLFLPPPLIADKLDVAEG